MALLDPRFLKTLVRHLYRTTATNQLPLKHKDFTHFFNEEVLITKASRRCIDYKIKKKDFTHFKTKKSPKLYQRFTSTKDKKHKKDKDH